jgi:hypothetical protein
VNMLSSFDVNHVEEDVPVVVRQQDLLSVSDGVKCGIADAEIKTPNNVRLPQTEQKLGQVAASKSPNSISNT